MLTFFYFIVVPRLFPKIGYKDSTERTDAKMLLINKKKKEAVINAF